MCYKIIDKLLNVRFKRTLNDKFKIMISDNTQAKPLEKTAVSVCFSYQEALDFLQLHTPIAVKPIKKSKYKFVQPFTSINARDIVIFSLATELSKNTKYINAFDFLTELREKSEWHNLIINDNALAGKMVEFAELYFKARTGLK